jgi:hypothetical protein
VSFAPQKNTTTSTITTTAPPRPRFQTKTEDGTTVRDLYRLELEVFQDPKMVRDRHREQYLLTIK